MNYHLTPGIRSTRYSNCSTRSRIDTEQNTDCYKIEAIGTKTPSVGYLTSGNYGHYLKGAIGLGYIKCNNVGESIKDILSSSYQIDVAGHKIDADVSIKPMYDPKSLKIKI